MPTPSNPNHSIKLRTVTLYVLTFLIGAALIFSLLVHSYATIHGLYTNNLSQAKAVAYRQSSYTYANSYFYYAVNNDDNSYDIPDYIKATVTNPDGTVLWTNQTDSNESVAQTFTYLMPEYNTDTYHQLEVNLTLDNSFTQYLPYSVIDQTFFTVYRLKGSLPFIILGLSVLFLLCLFGLIHHIRHYHTVRHNQWTRHLNRLPFDILCLSLIVEGLLLLNVINILISNRTTRYAMIPELLYSLVLSFNVLMAIDGFAYRLIQKTLSKTLWIRWAFVHIINGFKRLYMALPSIYLFVALIASIIIMNVILLNIYLYDADALFLIAIFNIVLLLSIIIYMYYQFMHYERATKNLAVGQWDYTVPTRFAFGHFRNVATYLNQSSHGMQQAIETQLKSERMKTDLITNVSHDLKTPLTSIINYSDLITRELSLAQGSESNNILDPSTLLTLETTKDFATTLHHESRKLLLLINNLIEASRASSGNLDCVLEPSDTSVILEQLEGEYERSMSAQDLEWIVEPPQELPSILADQRHLWRVFDNLMTNIMKYSLPNTRVYLSVTYDEQYLSFVFRNISRDRITISADELTERFVQSDTSRHTEGHGLGLSIARSLMSLQKGTLTLHVNGDMFSATASFPLDIRE